VDVAFGAALAGLPLDGGKNGGQVSFVVDRSELDYGKARDSLEIPEVQRRDFVAEMQRCRADQQILERQLDTNRFLLAFDTPGQPRNGERDRCTGTLLDSRSMNSSRRCCCT
jgi:hypothetical protein